MTRGRVRMKIEIVEENENSMRFSLSGATSSYANTLRRIATNSVKTFAIDRVTVYENGSAMFDEYIAHRIGLVPIHTPTKGYDEKDEVLFTLEAEGPKTVYSSDLACSDKEVRVANGQIPLIKLAEGQKVRLEGKAVMGTALRHAKFQPGLVTYDTNDNSTYAFYVESFGQMQPRAIINKAFEVIKDEIDDVEKAVKKL